jgi:hypothetical protein
VIRGWLVSLFTVAFVVVGSYLLFTYRLDIYDQLRLLSYDPPQEIEAIANTTTMQGRGRDLFYASNPKVEDRDLFNTSCADTGEQSVVLGCYRQQSIYIYNVTDVRLNGVKEVTAAHEMLHAAYERLSSGERTRINSLLTVELAKIKDERLGDLIRLYNEAEPGQLLNEMHSILGTEYSGLSSELETYYKQYFADRSKVVALASGYSQVFTESQKHIELYDSQLSQLKAQIDSNSESLDGQKASLDTQFAQLTTLRNSNPAAYNAAVPGYNANVNAYNSLANTTRDLVDEYNRLVGVRNQEVAVQNDLYHSLDSNYQTVSAD